MFLHSCAYALILVLLTFLRAGWHYARIWCTRERGALRALYSRIVYYVLRTRTYVMFMRVTICVDA